MISYSHFPLLLCSCFALLSSSLAQTEQLANVIANQRNQNPDQQFIILNSAVKYTIGPTPMNLTTDLVLVVDANGGQPRLECDGTCFHLFGGASLFLSQIDVEFGIQAVAAHAALVSVAVPTISPFGVANVTISSSKVQSHKFVTANASLVMFFPLILHEYGATMRHVKIRQSVVNVDMLTMLDTSTGDQSVSGSTPPLTVVYYDMISSSMVCGRRNADCISFDGRGGMGFVIVANSSLQYLTPFVFFSDLAVVLLSVQSTSMPAQLPNISIQSLSVPSGEQLFFRFANDVFLDDVTLKADASIVVSSVGRVLARNVTQLASNDRLLVPITFFDVLQLTMEDVTIVGFETTSAECALLPVISVASSSYRAMSDPYVFITRLKANGTFCSTPGLGTAIVDIKDIENVQVAESVFDGVKTQRALMVQNASIVNVLRSRFVNSLSYLPGFVRVVGADAVRTQLKVENVTFQNIQMQMDSALIASKVVATLRGVDFTRCTEPSTTANTIAALTLDAANWAFSSDVLLEDVIFVENNGSGIARIHVASEGTARSLQLRRVRFSANQATGVVCKLSGASNYTLDNVNMFGNTAQTVLSFPDNTPIMGKAERVCMCGNTASTDSSCLVSSLLMSNSSVMVGRDVNCFASERACLFNDICSIGFSNATVISITTKQGSGSSTVDATGTAPRATGIGTATFTTPTTSTTTTTTTTTTTMSLTSSTMTKEMMAPTTTATRATSGLNDNASSSSSSIGSGGSGSQSTISSSMDGSVEPTSMSNSTATVVTITLDSAAQDEVKDMSIWDDPAVLGGLIGGILAFVLLLTIAIVVGVIIVKRRTAGAAAVAPTTNEGDVQLTSTGGSSSRTSNYGSIQSALPASYGESKFSDLE
jgi:hypothetical protein